MNISVVIPAYNEEKLLPKTLESLASQTRKPDEVIVVDGESTDNTATIAKSSGARVITIPKTTIGNARQKGLLAATGEVIATLDADTVAPPSWLSRIQQALSKPGVVACYSGYRVDGGWLPYRIAINVFHPFFFALSRFWKRPISPGQNTAYKKSAALSAGGYPTDFQSAEDIELMRRLKTVGKILYLPDNYVLSSGRRGNEGFAMFLRVGKGLWKYYTKGSADTFAFPHVR